MMLIRKLFRIISILMELDYRNIIYLLRSLLKGIEIPLHSRLQLRLWAKCNGKLTFQQLVRPGISMKSISSALAYWFLQVSEKEKERKVEKETATERRHSRVSFCKIKLIRLKASISRPRQVTTRRSTVARTKLLCLEMDGGAEGVRLRMGQAAKVTSIDFWKTTIFWGESGPLEMLDTWQCRCCTPPPSSPRQLHR